MTTKTVYSPHIIIHVNVSNVHDTNVHIIFNE